MTDFTNAVSQAREKLEDLNKKHAELIKAMQSELQESMKSAFETFFKANPGIGALTWTQYTPHFNDGEPCTFGVNDIYVCMAKGNDDDEDFEYDPGEAFEFGVDRYDLPTAYELEKKGEIEAAKFVTTLQQMPEEVFEAMFGDHAEVVVNRNGIFVEEYGHD